MLRGALRKLHQCKANFTPVGISAMEDFIGRGDRRIGAVIKRAWELGATNDAWWQSQEQAFQAWTQAIAGERGGAGSSLSPAAGGRWAWSLGGCAAAGRPPRCRHCFSSAPGGELCLLVVSCVFWMLLLPACCCRVRHGLEVSAGGERGVGCAGAPGELAGQVVMRWGSGWDLHVTCRQGASVLLPQRAACCDAKGSTAPLVWVSDGSAHGRWGCRATAGTASRAAVARDGSTAAIWRVSGAGRVGSTWQERHGRGPVDMRQADDAVPGEVEVVVVVRGTHKPAASACASLRPPMQMSGWMRRSRGTTSTQVRLGCRPLWRLPQRARQTGHSSHSSPTTARALVRRRPGFLGSIAWLPPAGPPLLPAAGISKWWLKADLQRALEAATVPDCSHSGAAGGGGGAGRHGVPSAADACNRGCCGRRF